MVVQLVELGPFGCSKNREEREHIEDIPEGYRPVSGKATSDCVMVYIEPKFVIRNGARMSGV